ncbi:MAG: D-alanine--D-alanine ligase [Acidimicrobiaceae bacterium]|nr:D-alanine--D-alanine ligase [Acidimicrobiaceae bacterium]
MPKKKILVVLGGTSREREVSLESAKSCIAALKKTGYQVSKFDPKFLPISEIGKIDVDVIFNALHGKGGEDGRVQSFFEYFRIPYTHSGVLSSMITMNKYFSKQLFIKNRIRTPNYFFLNRKDYLSVNLMKKIKKNKLNFPIVIKPNDEGSSIGVKICKNLNSLKTQFKKSNNNYDNLIFETYIPGKEIQVAVVGGKSIGAIELRPKRKFYDYKAKYKKSAKTLHIMPAEISKKKYREVLRISKKANKILKCKGIVRCDFRFYKNKFFLLEVNTQPGMTSLSLVPEIAKHSKISFVQLVKWMVNDASISR